MDILRFNGSRFLQLWVDEVLDRFMGPVPEVPVVLRVSQFDNSEVKVDSNESFQVADCEIIDVFRTFMLLFCAVEVNLFFESKCGE